MPGDDDIHKLLRDAFDATGGRSDSNWGLERFALDLWMRGALDDEQLARLQVLMHGDD
ncbi:MULTISPECIES: hypothetical protein [Bifidobacterium]|jgi:hypothetical protein|nr:MULTISPECIES: hypothetical protein [Bifidobacterium]MCH3973496.1 hypothetical protein [Bifidobacterium tibiigranuli]MCH4190630.1 hypothetical protein [Bifidobacterium tibiigranuli]QOL36469.1 hypothetical protein BS3272_00140 [Bifidobacterium subtile]